MGNAREVSAWSRPLKLMSLLSSLRRQGRRVGGARDAGAPGDGSSGGTCQALEPLEGRTLFSDATGLGAAGAAPADS